VSLACRAGLGEPGPPVAGRRGDVAGRLDGGHCLGDPLRRGLQARLEPQPALPPLIERMRTAVAAAGLDEEVALGCRAVEETSVHAPGYDPAGLWRLKGLLDLSPAQQAMAMALYAWRDGAAKERDIPPGRILNGDLLVALARTQPVAFGQLRSLGVHGRLLHDHGEAVIACVQQAKAAPPEVPPRTRAREVEPVEELREEALKQWRRQESEQRALATDGICGAQFFLETRHVFSAAWARYSTWVRLEMLASAPATPRAVPVANAVPPGVATGASA
jgi:hypothetical protein